jgi:hypothetical protein
MKQHCALTHLKFIYLFVVVFDFSKLRVTLPRQPESRGLPESAQAETPTSQDDGCAQNSGLV